MPDAPIYAEAQISLTIQGGGVHVPPPAAPAPLRPRIRLYNGDAIAGSRPSTRVLINDVGEFIGYNRAIGNHDTSPVCTLPSPAGAGNVLLAVTFGSGTGFAPSGSGWALAASQSGLRVYWKVAAGGEQSVSPASAQTPGSWYITLHELTGLTATPVDQTATQTGSVAADGGDGNGNPTLLNLTTAATTQDDELVLAFLGLTPGSTLDYGGGGYQTAVPFVTRPQGYTAAYFGLTAVGQPNALLFGWERLATVTGAQAISNYAFTNPFDLASSGTYRLIMVTLKAAPLSGAEYEPVGEFDVASGTINLRAWAMADGQVTVLLDDPAAVPIRENTVVEVVDAARGLSEWLYVRGIEQDETARPRRMTLTLQDLRGILNSRPVEYGGWYQASTYVTASTYRYAEDWAHALITYLCIAPPAAVPAPIQFAVPDLAFAHGSYHRGTYYQTSPPVRIGSPLGEVLRSMLKRDGLDYRLAVVNAGTSTAGLAVSLVAGAERSIGLSGEVVFAAKWDTARGLRYRLDAIDTVTSLTAMGKITNLGLDRQEITVQDPEAVRTWGVTHGRVDASTEPALTEAVTEVLLTERAPKEWVELEPRDVPHQQVFTHYGLMDRVSVVTEDALVVSAQVTQIAITLGQGAQASLAEVTEQVPVPVQPGFLQPPVVTLTLGQDPESNPDGGRDRHPAALRQVWAF